ncbi:MAG TPA: glycoside hydrolase family 3 C-terminal domain-containing protein [Opitutaceae bacterium]|nr:glycoside hydrolase family 3 C-terminal domain-containing protein [Opitutaceae bacterium]
MRPHYPAVLLACSALAGALRAETPLYRDPSQPIEARVKDLVSRLTLDEKAGLMKNGAMGVPRLGIPQYDWWNEALHGVARAGVATVYPQAIGLSATWDDSFVRAVADNIGTEARAKYNDAVAHGNRDRFFGLTFWTPNINIFRDPRWGRGQETYGEDPFLTSRMGVAFVRGLQGTDPRYLKAAACAKHFVVHSGPEPLRHDFDAEPDPVDFHETYLPAFEALVREAHVEAVMTAYNSLYGRPCAINSTLYDLLYHQWGFNGHVVSDCGAIRDLYTSYKVAPDAAGAEALAVRAGLCLRCGEEKSAIADAVRRGLLQESEVDLRLGQLMRTMFRLGFFDPPAMVPYSRIPLSENHSPAHAAQALDAAEKSIVLLKNDGTLPLQAGSLRRVAVIGPNAASLPALLGNYNGTPAAPVTILDGLKAALGTGVAVDYVRGCDWTAARPGSVIIPTTQLLTGNDLSGLIGQYFAGPDLAGAPLAQRRDRPVGFDDGRASFPPEGVPADFSCRWSGWLLNGVAGEYDLTVSGKGGFRLFLDGKPVIDAWSGGAASRSASVRLPENARTPLRLEYRNRGEAPAIALRWSTPPADAGYAAALAAARQADAVVFVGGLTAQLEGEEMLVDSDGFHGGDRTKIELPEVQERLLQELKATGKPMVFVLMSGSAVAIPWENEHLNAILEAWYPGESGGTAVADVLLGKVNPAGRLPITFYRSTSDLPAFTDYDMKGRTYRYFRGKPLYPFGYGLSYSQFAYDHLKVAALPGGGATATVDVTNRGRRVGDEVVEFYAREPANGGMPPIHDPKLTVSAGAAVDQPGHEAENESLCGFRRIHLAPGETQVVTLPIAEARFRRWDPRRGDWYVPAGAWTVAAGASSADLRQSAEVAFP